MKRFFFIVFAFLFTTCLPAQELKSIKITDLEKTIAESKGPLIINFWATFCVPCIEEIPYFQEEVKKYEKEGLQLLLVSLDMKSFYPEKIRAFVKKRKFTAPMVWLNETNANYFCDKIDPKWSGAIPATLFVNNKTGYRRFLEQEMSRAQLQKEIEAMLQGG